MYSGEIVVVGMKTVALRIHESMFPHGKAALTREHVHGQLASQPLQATAIVFTCALLRKLGPHHDSSLQAVLLRSPRRMVSPSGTPHAGVAHTIT
jgi:hypothetical protein